MRILKRLVSNSTSDPNPRQIESTHLTSDDGYHDYTDLDQVSWNKPRTTDTGKQNTGLYLFECDQKFKLSRLHRVFSKDGPPQ